MGSPDRRSQHHGSPAGRSSSLRKWNRRRGNLLATMFVPALETLIDDRPAEGVFRVHREAFRNADLFAREMTTFFEGGWVFVGHTSQLPNRHDFLTTRIGRQALVLMR